MNGKAIGIALALVATVGAQAPQDAASLVRRADELRRSDAAAGRETAEALYRQAWPLVASDRGLGARIALELGALTAGRGDLSDSQAWFTKAIDGYDAAGDKPGFAAAVNQMGSILLTLGDVAEARAMYARSRSIWAALDNARGQAQTHANDALAWRASGDLQRALESNRVATDLFIKAGDRAGEATARHNNSEVLIDLGDFDEAIRVATQALALHRAAGPMSGEIHTLIHLAEAWYGKQDLRRAGNYLVEAAARSRDLDAPVQRAYILRETGRIHMAMKQPAQAMAQFEAALVHVPDAGFPRMEAEIEVQRGQAAFMLRRLDVARTAWTRARDLAAEIEHPLLQASALVGLARLDRDGGAMTDALAHVQQATRFIEASRATLGSPVQRAAYLATRIGAFGLETDILVRQGHLALAFETSERAHARVLLDLLTPPDVVPQPVSAATIRASLDAGTAALEYMVGDDVSWLFVLTRESIRAFRLPDGATIGRAVSALRETTARPGLGNFGAFVRASREAHRMLIAPALGVIKGKTRLVIVADGALHTLPFEVLSDGAADAFGSLPYLIRDRSVSYAASLSVEAAIVARRRTTQTAAAADVVVFARPDAAPGLPALRHVEAEGRAVVSLFPGRSQLLLGSDASEAALRRPDVLRARRLHFATHGVLRPPPGLSGLALGSAAPGDEGYLDASEVARLRISADLVVLSGCDTGLGRHVVAEGTLGLTRAFLEAGASGVVSSLWPVDDRSTATLMTAFYSRLDRGTADALRFAKLGLIQQPQLAHPYFWAGFTLNGR